MPHVLAHVDAVAPDVLALDSIQTVVDPDLPGAPGSVTQVRDCAYRLVQQAKERALSTVLVGHVTKEGTLAGPRVLEHVVDTVLSFDGDRGHSLRLLHALKHRFGGTHELGLFEMTERGLVDVPDASARFLVDRRPGVPGSAVAAVLEGARPLLVEVQALVMRTGAPVPRAVGVGHRPGAAGDAARGARAARGRDVSPAPTCTRASPAACGSPSPALDLALRARGRRALSSAPRSRRDTVAIGELGLGGEVRSVPQLERRLAEAARLGFRTAVVPPGDARRRQRAGPATVDARSAAWRHAVEQALIPRRADARVRMAGTSGILVASPSTRDAEQVPRVRARPCPPHRDRKP